MKTKAWLNAALACLLVLALAAIAAILRVPCDCHPTLAPPAAGASQEKRRETISVLVTHPSSLIPRP
jgi:hypothetical protein